jgi:3-hydroxyacyl-[acyl-carrier-protein] dehydratase
MRFLLVDQILELEPLKRIVTTKEIGAEEDYFPDHFPGYPVVPGVLQVEMMAQSAGKCLMAGIDPTQWPVLLQVRQANFRKSIFPKSKLRIEAEILSCNRSTASAFSKVWCESQTVADATLVFGFIDKSFLQADFQDEVLQAFLNKPASTT